MAKTTNEGRLMKIETTLEYIKKDLTENKEQHQQLIKKLDDFINSAPNKYADKKVEIKIANLEEKDMKRDLFLAKLVGAAIVIWFIIQAFLIPWIRSKGII